MTDQNELIVDDGEKKAGELSTEFTQRTDALRAMSQTILDSGGFNPEELADQLRHDKAIQMAEAERQRVEDRLNSLLRDVEMLATNAAACRAASERLSAEGNGLNVRMQQAAELVREASALKLAAQKVQMAFPSMTEQQALQFVSTDSKLTPDKISNQTISPDTAAQIVEKVPLTETDIANLLGVKLGKDDRMCLLVRRKGQLGEHIPIDDLVAALQSGDEITI